MRNVSLCKLLVHFAVAAVVVTPVWAQDDLPSKAAVSWTGAYNKTARPSGKDQRIGVGDSWGLLAPYPQGPIEPYIGGDMTTVAGDYIYFTQGETSLFYRYSVSNDVWEAMSPIPAPASGYKALGYSGEGDLIYLLSRDESDQRFRLFAYSVSTNQWRSGLAAPPGDFNGGSGVALVHIGNVLYATFGNGQLLFKRYSVADDSWSDLAPLPFGPDEGGSLLYLGTGDTIYLLQGGFETGFAAYSIASDTWSPLAPVPPMPVFGVYGGGDLAYPGNGDYIYATYGLMSPTAFSRFSISKNSWELKASPPVGFGGGGCLASGGGDRIYGYTGETNSDFLVYFAETIEGNELPVADAGRDSTVECTGSPTTAVALDGAGSSDPDRDPLTYLWSAPDVAFDDSTSPTPTGQFPLGTTTVTLTVSDGRGGTDTDTVEITIVDTTPPEIAVMLNRDVLWPPNHQMVDITATVSVGDICCAFASAFRLVSITSSEPDNGKGDGNTVGDFSGAAFGTPDMSFQLRAERSGTGKGRVYTIIYAAEDCSGNIAYDTIQVGVQHNGPSECQDEQPSETPHVTALLPSHPNPFNPTTTIPFALAGQGPVSLLIFDIQGRLVRTLCDGVMPAGTHEAVWDGRDNSGSRVATGVYFARFKAGSYQVTRKLVMVR